VLYGLNPVGQLTTRDTQVSVLTKACVLLPGVHIRRVRLAGGQNPLLECVVR
jgi:hypothetical protein